METAELGPVVEAVFDEFELEGRPVPLGGFDALLSQTPVVGFQREIGIHQVLVVSPEF